MDTYKKARSFIYRNARPVDLARWQYLFENGSKEAVLNALSYYQNEDGGFGRALEADSWNPNSSPIQTWTATEILHEIRFTEVSNPIIQGILRYLASGKDFNGRVWYYTIKSNNDYPHAPWWQNNGDNEYQDYYNPTACLAGFIIRFADKSSELYGLGCRIAKEAYEHLMREESQTDMHLLSCYIRLLEYCKEAKAEIIDIKGMEQRLRKFVSESLTKDVSLWNTGYVCKPSQYMNGKDSIFYEDNKELADYECEFIIKSQLEDGSWNIPWSWQDYPEEWAVSKIWWKSHVIINNLRYLKGMERL
jgi:hypothetical protein